MEMTDAVLARLAKSRSRVSPREWLLAGVLSATSSSPRAVHPRPILSVARRAAAGLYSNWRVQPAVLHSDPVCAWFLRRAGCPQSAGPWPRRALHYVMFVTSGWGWRACQPHHGDSDNITHNTPAWIHLLPSECLLPIYSSCSAVGFVRPCAAQPFARLDPLLGWWFVGALCALKKGLTHFQ